MLYLNRCNQQTPTAKNVAHGVVLILTSSALPRSRELNSAKRVGALRPLQQDAQTARCVFMGRSRYSDVVLFTSIGFFAAHPTIFFR